MYYFLNAYIPRFCSGIEHAEFKRLANFLAHGVPATIVTSTYNREASVNLAINHLDYSHYLNLYDYFCGNTAVPKLSLTPEMIAGDLRMDVRPDGIHCFNGNWESLCIHEKDGRVDLVDVFDGDHQVVRRDYYDTRGFKGFSQFFATTDDPSQSYVALESFYAYTGRVGVEITYRKRGTGIVATSYRLLHEDGRQWQLMNPEQMYTQLLDCINSGHDTFISDRSNITNRPMIKMTTPARKIEHFHNIHFADYHDPMHSKLTYPAIGETDLLSRTDLVITPTQAQADQMRERIKTTVPIVAVPVGVVPQAQLDAPRVDATTRIRGKVIVVARLYYEKHVDDAIWAFKMAHDQLDWLTLDIYGYGDGNTDHRDEKLAKQIVQDQGLDSVVTFKGYADDMNQVYDQAQALMLSSRYEGFVLAITEAASHGVPAVAYDCPYGPADQILPGESGELVPYGDVPGLAAALVKTMRDQAHLEKLSAGAYQRAKAFSQDAVWRIWQDKVIDTNK